jgi:O-antigen biosynthesis protein WbqP
VKRAFDLIVAVTLLAVSFPVILLLLAAIRLQSPGSPLFTQERVGRHKEPFRIYKLRTMLSGTADVASHKVEADRVTRLGRALRRLKLDELPQLWNVANGSMSLVGPRPCLFSQHELIAARDRLGLFGFRPGVTGPAQLVNLDMSEPLRLADVEADYFHRATWSDDARILVRTLLGQGAGDPAQVHSSTATTYREVDP